MSRATGAALVALFALGACGKSKDEQLFDERRQLCFAAGANHDKVSAAIAQLGALNVCKDFPPRADYSRPADGSLDGCPFDGTTRLMRFTFEWRAVDGSLCQGSACSYVCEVTYVGDAISLDAPICGVRFFSRQFATCF